MTKLLAPIEPSMLRWARESQGYSVEDVARFLKREPGEVAGWEAGTSAPTYAQIEKLAYGFLKRPLAVFFFSSPPQEVSPKKAFRTLPDLDLETLAADTRYQLRYARALQLSLAELHDEGNPAPRKIFADVKLSTSGTVQVQARRVRDYLGVSLEEQVSWRGEGRALAHWRRAVEEVGIFVFKHSFKQKAISGFSLLDATFPIVYLNNSTTKTRQIFSLFHELGHLLLQMNGISKFDPEYITDLPKPEQAIERFCNQLATELLIPDDDLAQQLRLVRETSDPAVAALAKRYGVSREAILRRLLDRGLVSRTAYEAKAKAWAGQQRQPSSGDYYATRVSYLGERYLRLVFGRHYQGKLSLEQVSDYLGVRARNLPGIEERVLLKAAAQ